MLRKGAQLRGGHVHRDGGQIELLQPRDDLLLYETARLLILHCDATDDDRQRRVAAVGMSRGSNVWRLTQFRPRVQARPAPEEGLIGPLGPSKKGRQSLLAQDNRRPQCSVRRGQARASEHRTSHLRVVEQV